jgi:heme iron utilization protein
MLRANTTPAATPLITGAKLRKSRKDTFMGKTDELQGAIALIRRVRWAALATAEDNVPYLSSVAYAPEEDLSGFLLHLSRLASHTERLMKNPRASLLISERDDGRADPQTLARISMTGQVEHAPRDAAQYAACRSIYLARLPESEPLFAFSDFELFRFVPEDIRYVSGFARAYTFTPDQLRKEALGRG